MNYLYVCRLKYWNLTNMNIIYLPKVKTFQSNFSVKTRVIGLCLLTLSQISRADTYDNLYKNSHDILSKTNVSFNRGENRLQLTIDEYEAFIGGVLKDSQEKIVIKGIVTDEEGVPVPGVNISV